MLSKKKKKRTFVEKMLFGLTAFQIACNGPPSCARMECVKLLAPLSDVNAQNDFGMTGLMFATKSDNIKLVKYLVEECKADPNLTTKDGRMALDFTLPPKKTYKNEVDIMFVDLRDFGHANTFVIFNEKESGSFAKRLARQREEEWSLILVCGIHPQHPESQCLADLLIQPQQYIPFYDGFVKRVQKVLEERKGLRLRGKALLIFEESISINLLFPAANELLHNCHHLGVVFVLQRKIHTDEMNDLKTYVISPVACQYIDCFLMQSMPVCVTKSLAICTNMSPHEAHAFKILAKWDTQMTLVDNKDHTSAKLFLF